MHVPGNVIHVSLTKERFDRVVDAGPEPTAFVACSCDSMLDGLREGFAHGVECSFNTCVDTLWPTMVVGDLHNELMRVVTRVFVLHSEQSQNLR